MGGTFENKNKLDASCEGGREGCKMSNVLAADVRTLMRRCECPLLTSDLEDDEAFANLLLTPSPQRGELLSWIAAKILGISQHHTEGEIIAKKDMWSALG